MDVNLKCKDKIMIYMGSYVKDRKYGSYNDYVTYENNPDIDYKSYIDLIDDNVYNINLNECKEFEDKNIIIKIPVESFSFDSYLQNYIVIRNWILMQLENNTKEYVTKKLMYIFNVNKSSEDIVVPEMVQIISDKIKEDIKYSDAKVLQNKIVVI